MTKFLNIFKVSAGVLSILFIASCSGSRPEGLIVASNACDAWDSKDCHGAENYDYDEDIAQMPLALEPKKVSEVAEVADSEKVVNQGAVLSKKIGVQVTKRRPTLKQKYNISVEINDIATERAVDKLHNPKNYHPKIASEKTEEKSVEKVVEKLSEEQKTEVEKQSAEQAIKPEISAEKTLSQRYKKSMNPILQKAKKESDFFLEEVLFSDLPNLEKDDIGVAFDTFMKSCAQFKKTDDEWIKSANIAIEKSHMMEICSDADNVKNSLPKYTDTEQKKVINGFFIEWFSPYKVFSKGTDKGTFTGYYESHIKGSTTATCDYLHPIYGLPDSAEHQKLTREEIESDAFRGKAKILFWAANPVDIFITQIQGSGVIETENGTKYRIGYAGNNGHEFTGTGAAMQEMGIRPEGGFSMASVRDYMKKNPTIARKIMNKNKRFIFFKENHQDGAIGTFGATLTPKRAIAVDAQYIPLGLPMYINVSDPDGRALDRVVVAADTGVAIKGGIRADFFFGSGEQAFQTAGRMKQTGKYFVFLPKNRDRFMVKSDNIKCLN